MKSERRAWIMQAGSQQFRGEVWILALLLRKPGITREDVNKLIPLLLEYTGSTGSPETVSYLAGYIDYLVYIGVVEDDNGRLYLRKERISNILMKYITRVAESDAMERLLSSLS